MSEHDPFEDLRGAWQSLDAPNATPEMVDPETQAVMEALRSEWSSLEAPPVRIPARLQRRSWRRRVPVALQVAAALLLLVGGSWWLRKLVESGGQIEALTDESRVASIDTPTPADVPPTPPVQVRAVEPAPIENGIVMTHGKVRLVMLTPETTYESLEGPQTTENSR